MERTIPMTMPARVRSRPAGSIRPACISRRSLLPITQVMKGKTGQVMNSPCYGHERPMANALVLVQKPKSPAAPRPDGPAQ